jgi:predicted phage terminase large subunit-like protein
VEYFERIKRLRTDRWQKDFCERLQNASLNRATKREWAIIHAEGQLGKSSILAQAYPAWLLGHLPLHRIALATYNVTRSQRHSKTVIGIMNLPIHKQIFPNKDGWVDEKASKEKWSTAARIELNDGQDSFNPVGLQSGLTGSGFDDLIIDDPYADQKEAFSETTRNHLQEFWDFTVMSRMGTYTNVFGMFHRYHVEDLAGYLLDKGSFDYWRYATVCDGDYIHDETGQRYPDPLGREIGEYISERRLPEYYDEVRKNNRVFSSMNQGRPSSEEGEFFNVGQIVELSEEETEQRRAECSVFVRSWDLAATEEGGDYSVGELWGMSADKQATLFDVVREQVDSAGRDKLQLATAQKDGFEVVISIPNDPGAAGNTAVFHIQQLLEGYQVVERATTGSKARRADALASAMNQGQVSFAKAEWNKEVKKEFRNFPLSDNDDCVDAGSDGYNECAERVAKGLIIQNPLPLLTKTAFVGQFGEKIPAKWTVYVGLHITPEANRANGGVIVARSPQITGVDSLFILAEYKDYTADYHYLFAWLDATLKEWCVNPQASVIWLHPESDTFQAVIRQKLSYGVRLFKEDEFAGIVDMNWYFQPDRLSAVVNDNQTIQARDAKGLIALRQEVKTWAYTDKGKPSKSASVSECLRMICHKFRTRSTGMTPDEKIYQVIPEETKMAVATATTAGQKFSAAIAYEFEEELAKMTLGLDELEEEFDWE